MGKRLTEEDDVLEVEAARTTERQAWGCWRAGDGGVLTARGRGIGYTEGVEAAGRDPRKRSGCRGSLPERLGAAELSLWAAPWRDCHWWRWSPIVRSWVAGCRAQGRVRGHGAGGSGLDKGRECDRG